MAAAAKAAKAAKAAEAAAAAEAKTRTRAKTRGPIPVKKLQEFSKASKSKKASPAKAAASSGTPSPKKKRASSTPEEAVTPDEPKAKKERVAVSAVREPIKVAKPTGGAFGVFLQEKGTAIKASLFDAKKSLGRMNQIAADRWKSLTEEEQKVFQSKYDSKVAAFKALPRSAKLFKVRKTQVRKVALLTADGKEVKRAPSAYFLFCEEKRESIKASLPADHKIQDIAKQAGALWKALPEEEKKIYQDKYDAKNAPYKEAVLASKPSAALRASKAPPAGGAGGAAPPAVKLQRRKRKRAW